MKKQIIILTGCFALLFGCADTKEQATSTTEKTIKEFKELANEEGFAEKHEIPSEVQTELKGEFVKIAVKNGEDANIYKVDHADTKNYLFVVHEWWGLNDHIINEADELYSKLGNVNVIALDLYDGRVAETREKATEYMQGVDEDRLNNIINAVLETLPADAKVGTIGWCFGGGWSLKTALLAKEKTAACVIYYGMPVDDKERLRSLNSDALFIYADQDKWITPEIAKKFVDNMLSVDKIAVSLGFEADHAFANPSSERYNEEAARDANSAALNYLKERMK